MIHSRVSLTVLAAASLALPSVGLAGSARQFGAPDQGIVQGASAATVSVRALDGSVTDYPLAGTKILGPGGLKAAAADLQPGVVVSVFTNSAGLRVVKIVPGLSPVIERGTVIGVGPAGELTISQEAPGATVTVSVDPTTVVVRVGKSIAVEAVGVGDRVEVTHQGSLPASRIKVTASAPPLLERGILRTVGATSVVVRTDAGSLLTIPIDGQTRFRLSGKLIALGAVRPGVLVSSARVAGRAARVLLLTPHSDKASPAATK